MGWALSRADEFFTHQVAFPHGVVGSSDPHWRERYWFSLHDVESQAFILSLGFGKYPNQDVMEAFAIAAVGPQQHNLRVSRQLGDTVDEVAVGPLSVQVVEPLRELRIDIAPNPAGIEGRLHWTAALPAMLEGRHFEVSRSRVSHDLTRYVQLGRVAGSLRIDDQRFDLDPARVWSERDHSWGIRPMAPFAGQPPSVAPDWNFLAFCPLQFAGFAVHLYLFERQAGQVTHLSASIVRGTGGMGEPAADEIEAVEHDFEWAAGAPVATLVRGRVCIRRFDVEPLVIDLEALAPRVYLKGGGYGVDHGRWKGASHLEHETWDLADAAALPGYAAASSDHLVRARCGGEVGYGVIEYMIRRAHRRYAAALPPSRAAAPAPR